MKTVTMGTTVVVIACLPTSDWFSVASIFCGPNIFVGSSKTGPSPTNSAGLGKPLEVQLFFSLPLQALPQAV